MKGATIIPDNDGTNSCAFLSLHVMHALFSNGFIDNTQSSIVTRISYLIENFPERLLDLSGPRPPTLLSVLRPSAPSPRPSCFAKVYNIFCKVKAGCLIYFSIIWNSCIG